MTKYFSFQGLAKRSEFWAVNLIVIFGGWLALVAMLIFSGLVAMSAQLIGGLFVISSFATWYIATMWLLLAVGVRRCRDADISVFWVIPLALPILSVIMLIILGILPTVDKNFIPNDKT